MQEAGGGPGAKWRRGDREDGAGNSQGEEALRQAWLDGINLGTPPSLASVYWVASRRLRGLILGRAKPRHERLWSCDVLGTAPFHPL